ncbi:MAG TPA: FAD binding domain-containing protein [Burkholderiales bacterium]|nr:FAD binding domain-containing protein [Burkholderiales bacterium]
MSPFQLVQPASLAEALEALSFPDTRPFSGGTALMLMMKAGMLRPARLVRLARCGLGGIQVRDGALHVGAFTTLSALEKADAVRKGWPVIARTLRTLANVRVRNVATVGGALAHGDPHMDLPPLLSALGARVRIAGPRGERTAAVEDLYKGYLETTLDAGEIITRVEVPPLEGRGATYLKFTTRSADDWPAVGIAVVLGKPERIFVGAATDRPMPYADNLPIQSDLHGSAEYKRHLIKVLLPRALDEARNARR